MVRAAEPGDAAPEPTWTDAQRQHWSFRPLARPAVPPVEGPGRGCGTRSTRSSSADRGVRAEARGRGRPGDADPPAPVRPDRPAAHARGGRRVRRRSRGPTPTSGWSIACWRAPQYGERWARSWLDLARFAESDGFKSDKTRPNAWRYRDWVVEALNADMPYDRFVALQLAGDEVAPGDPEAFVATGFNRNWPFEDNNKVPGLNRQLMLDDMTDTTASVFLGLTVGCARCHDHKYDPISQKDYYRFQALFAATAPKDDFPLARARRRRRSTTGRRGRAPGAGRRGSRREIDAIEQPYRRDPAEGQAGQAAGRGPQGVRDRARGAVGVPGRPAQEERQGDDRRRPRRCRRP